MSAGIVVMPRRNMPLHSIHRAASIATHKTYASIRSVFTSHGHSKSSPIFVTISEKSLLISQTSLDKVGDAPSEDGRSRINHEERIFDAFDGSDSSSDDDGYYTACEDCREFEENRDSDFSTREGEDVRQTEYGMHEGFSKDNGQKWDEQSRPTGKRSGLEISDSYPVSELRDSVIDSESEERLKEVDDATLLRFLRARKMDVAKASDMFIKDWRWRNQFAPQGCISEDAVSRQLEAEKAFLQGIDKKGRPLLVIIGAKHFSKDRDLEEFKRYCYYCIEKVIASMPAGKEQYVILFDSAGTGFRNVDTSASLMMADFLQAHYPERMAKLFLVNTSTLFHGVYKLIEPAVDPITRTKIIMVNDTEMETLFTEEIGKEILPRAYGGTADLIPIQYAKINKESYPCKAIYSL